MSSKFHDEERQDEQSRAAHAFAAARDLQAHDRLRVSEECRCRIQEIESAARDRRKELLESQAMTWEDDVRAEKAYLLLEKPAPVLKPGEGFLRGGKVRKETVAELTQRAERNVDQDNERALRKTFILEDSLINVAVLEDLRAFEAEREAPKAERDRDAPRAEPEAGTWEHTPVRDAFTREASTVPEPSAERAAEHDEPAHVDSDIEREDSLGSGERDGGRER